MSDTKKVKKYISKIYIIKYIYINKKARTTKETIMFIFPL